MPTPRDRRLSFAVALGLLLLTELGLRLAGPAWQAQRPLELVSLPLLQDRLKAQAAEAKVKTLLLIGDSVVYGSALREHAVPEWRQQTPRVFLGRDLAPKGWQVADLSADGLYGPDIERLAELGLQLKPAAVVIELNYRMLSAEAAGGPKASSRPWLDGSDRLDALRRGVATFRYAELASALCFQPTLQDVMKRGVKRLFATDEGDADQNAAMLQMKLRPYYAAPAVDAGHQGLQALSRLRARLEAKGLRSLIFLTPQNQAAFESYLDARAYAANRRALKRAMGPAYRDWSERRGRGSFYDHCHWDPQGNQQLAEWIEAELKP